MLEEGERFTHRRLHRPPARDDRPALPRRRADRSTVGNAPIVLPLGRGRRRHDDDQLRHLLPHAAGRCSRCGASASGSSELTPDELDPYFRRVERIINVAQVPPELAGRNAEVVKRGADALGWSGDFIYRNVRGCVGSGVCAFGCPTSRQAVGQPELRAAGLGRGRDDLHGHAGRRTSSSPATAPARSTPRTTGGGRLRVETDDRHRRLRRDPHAAASCAATAWALQLGRARRQPRDPPGHGGARAVRGRADRHGPRRARSRYYIDEFADERIMFEGAAGPPDYLAMSLPFSRERHRDLMLRFQQLLASSA